MNAKFCVIAALLFFTVARAVSASFWQVGNVLVMSNVNVRLEYNLTAGITAFFWNNSQKISAFYSGVGLKSGYVKGINFGSRSWSVVNSNQVAVTAHAAGLPIMTQ